MFRLERINLRYLESGCLWSCARDPAERIEKVFDDAHVVIAAYLEPGARNAEESLDQLIRIIDDRELYDAVAEMLRVEGRAYFGAHLIATFGTPVGHLSLHKNCTHFRGTIPLY